jgi:PEP-CTERM motif-containing protein
MSTAPAAPVSWLANRRAIGIGVAILALAVAAGLSISSFWRPGGGANNGVQNALTAGANGVSSALSAVQSVADMLAGRSPGERAEGTLANLKHRKLAALHERALPKVRRPAAASPLAGIVGAAPVPPAEELPPPAAPLYNVVAGGPGASIAAPPSGSGPVVFPAIPPPPGGGGGVIIPPPAITPPVTPPVTPPIVIPPPPAGAVPEPSTWAMMILGFAMIGRALRVRARTKLHLAAR